MKIVSYNVNGIRAAVKKGFLDWLKENDFDIVALQETKAQDAQLPMEALHDLGYEVYHEAAEKKGYSGVAVLTRLKPLAVIHGMGIQKYDSEGRVIRLKFDQFELINTYFPSGSSSEERHAFKMQFLNDYAPFIQGIKSEKPMIVVGDYNIVHKRADIHNPDRKDNPSGYRPEERQWMSDWFDNGFTDSFRKIYPETDDVFSWWSYRASSRARNKGWRIDYISVDDRIIEKLSDADHLVDAVHSDHCPVLAVVDF